MAANAVLLGLIALAMTSGARAQFSAEQVKALPACQGADVDTFAARASQPPCSSWLQAAMGSPCPESCAEALDAAGEECFAAFLVFQYEYLGVPINLDAAAAYTNATFSACADGLPTTIEAEVELGKAALSAFPSCDSADLEAAVTSNCSSAVIIASLFSGLECTPACSQAVKAYGVDCLLDTAIATLEKLRPGGGGSDSVRATIKGLLSKCTGTARRLLRASLKLGELELLRDVLASLATAKLF